MINKEKQRHNLITYTCTENGITLREVLEGRLSMSSRFIAGLKREKNVYVNKRARKFDYMLEEDDTVEIRINEEPSEFKPQDIDLKVVYEDFDILVVDKPPFMVVHPTKSHDEATLANAAAHYFKSRNEKMKIRFVNRLDMNTSGLVVIAKNPYAHHIISEDMAKDNVAKKYITVVKGVPENEEGTIDIPIYRPTEDSIKRTADSRGQSAVTHYRIKEKFQNAALLEVRIETGRTHQIRVHLSHIGHPIIGDELYGYVDESLIERQALHACGLELRQPRLRDKIELQAGIPDDFVSLIEKLKAK